MTIRNMYIIKYTSFNGSLKPPGLPFFYALLLNYSTNLNSSNLDSTNKSKSSNTLKNILLY